MRCPSCGAENEPGRKFCGECGSPLARLCPSCGSPNAPSAKFCGECGSALTADAPPSAPRIEVPTAERRLVTVLFADLVGFTAASERRDAEDTRELLSNYFELARKVITRYGGTVEKFIGDAVMAVWGTPTATEDDAERAVRAALELVAAVPDLDSALRARAGVLTGEAAVTIGAQGEGMVAGDLVNTASRIQSAAEPGTVLVGAATLRATEQSIAYESAGEQLLKGKEEAVALWRALRVVSAVGGALKSGGLEPPFMGRDRELKLIKDLFHASADERKAHLVSITGIAGIGKSRLAWEFYKYFDGVVETVYWHRGRSLAYGEGVAFWALADMVRMRCRIVEDEDPASARAKLRATLEQHVPDADERSYIEPRLAQLLGFEDGKATDQQDLFAAWRLLFERLAASGPTVLAFEDLQWADTGLLDFIESLLEWSRNHPIFVLTLARPELHERRPGWGAGQRSFTSLYLEPLSEPAMREVLDGLVPGLPPATCAQILARAQGVPLYAVETIRMLIDRGLLVPDGDVYRPAGEIDRLEVPETLQALIAARLDGLSPDERRLLQDAAVLGKTFSRAAVAAVAGLSEDQVDQLLAGLLKKEVLSLQSDPRSPERGQYGFLQDLVRHVAYESLAKRDRRARHLAAADYLEGAFAQEDEVAEVLASHLVAAYHTAPDAEDAPSIRDRAREMLVLAGDRAASVGAPLEARMYYGQAVDLSDDPIRQAELLLLAGNTAARANRHADARAQFERALELVPAAEDLRTRSRIVVALADLDLLEGKAEESIALLKDALAGLDGGRPDAAAAPALAELGRLQSLIGQPTEAFANADRALWMAERLQLTQVFLDALVTRATTLLFTERFREARILLEAALDQAASAQLYGLALRAANNLIVVDEMLDRPLQTVAGLERASELARMRGDRRWESQLRLGGLSVLYLIGRWDEAVQIAADEQESIETQFSRGFLLDVGHIHIARGELEPAAAIVAANDAMRDAPSPELRGVFLAHEALLQQAQGRVAEAQATAEQVLDLQSTIGFESRMKMAVTVAVECAVAQGDLARAEQLLEIPRSLYPGQRTTFVDAETDRLMAKLELARGDTARVEERLRNAVALFAESGHVVHRATAQLELAEWLAAAGRALDAEAPLAEARALFQELRAAPWLERCARLPVGAATAQLS